MRGQAAGTIERLEASWANADKEPAQFREAEKW